MMVKRLNVVILFLLALQACNSKQVLPSEPPIISTKTPIVLPSRIVPSPTQTRSASTTPTSVSLSQTPTQTPVVETPLDQCKLVLQSSVEAILGEPAQVSRELNKCVYLANSGSLSISIGTIAEGEIKTEILNYIAQLRAGCSLRFEYTSAEPTSTPFPSEIQELADLSLAELMILQDEAFKDCAWALPEGIYQTIDGLGDMANFMVWDLVFWEVGVVSVALDETYLFFHMTTNQDLDRDLALEAGIALIQESLAGLR